MSLGEDILEIFVEAQERHYPALLPFTKNPTSRMLGFSPRRERIPINKKYATAEERRRAEYDKRNRKRLRERLRRESIRRAWARKKGNKS